MVWLFRTVRRANCCWSYQTRQTIFGADNCIAGRGWVDGGDRSLPRPGEQKWEIDEKTGSMNRVDNGINFRSRSGRNNGFLGLIPESRNAVSGLNPQIFRFIKQHLFSRMIHLWFNRSKLFNALCCSRLDFNLWENVQMIAWDCYAASDAWFLWPFVNSENSS